MSALLAPRYWGIHLLMVVALAAAGALGVWQYHVWQVNRAAAAVDLTSVKPKPLTSVMTGDGVLMNDDVDRPVTFHGTWMPEGTLYVSDRRHDGRRGYWVMTPVLVGHSAMPVVRGWSATTDAPRPSGQVEVTGWLQASEAGDTPDRDPSDDVIPDARIASMVEHVDADLYGAFVIAERVYPDGDAVAGLSGVRPPPSEDVGGLTSLRNLLYAFQWWIFGGFAVYIWVRWCRDEIEARDVRAVAGAG